ncbi:glycosyltransferase [Aestuariicella hydrocarbonica]|uniref:Glycosyltransferase n=1 Tax=Pseudomaricurvus hydrocarbonicus TaxID=1470433 RepID=A0A9E5MLP4_9GAMM|nr:glycosyltransferase [Aestuariicella hydrocarbonica]NHO65108.1 glycosyltransferase [Aestuariicella hydrocarbonica]
MKQKVAIFRSTLLQISETFIRDQANTLSSWEPILIGRTELNGGLKTPNIKREIVPELGSTLHRLFHFWLQRPETDLVQKLQQLQVSLVHAHFGTDATRIWPSVKAAKLPMLVTLHGQDINIHRKWWEAGHGGLRGKVYPRRLLSMAKDPSVYFIAVSKAIKQKAIEYGIPEEKINVSYIGVDTARFEPGSLPIGQRRKRILFVGRMVEKKAPLAMIRAYAEVRIRIPDIELVMIGTGPLLEDAKQLAKELAVDVEFLGTQSSDEVLAQLHQAQVFCLPSVTAENGDAEGLPIAILEAMSCGIPCIATRHSGNQEAISNNFTGYLIPEKGHVEFVEVLTLILNNPENLYSMSKNARHRATQYFNIQLNSTLLEANYIISTGQNYAQ